ncbi:uncharacterized protein LOC134194790 [Corticium candelabrum]|uniref:uncharacterized protein LOC134194790 n=1 Tax=Corticium candelabrum TaxID=121492 RepID=UPI002E25DE22|nr:uncharacterized protein LOC134194790 [Corticium candelabrum]
MEKFLYSIVGLKKPLEELDVKQALVALSIVYLTLHWSYVQKFTDTETKEYVYNCVLWILSILAFATKVYHIFQNGFSIACDLTVENAIFSAFFIVLVATCWQTFLIRDVVPKTPQEQSVSPDLVDYHTTDGQTSSAQTSSLPLDGFDPQAEVRRRAVGAALNLDDEVNILLLLQFSKELLDLWEEIGVALKIPKGDLKNIEHKHRDDLSKRLFDVLKLWCDSEFNPTVGALVEACKCKGVNAEVRCRKALGLIPK